MLGDVFHIAAPISKINSLEMTHLRRSKLLCRIHRQPLTSKFLRTWKQTRPTLERRTARTDRDSSRRCTPSDPSFPSPTHVVFPDSTVRHNRCRSGKHKRRSPRNQCSTSRRTPPGHRVLCRCRDREPCRHRYLRSNFRHRRSVTLQIRGSRMHRCRSC